MPTLAQYLHDLSPIIVRLHGDFAIRWYGMAYVVGFALAYFVLRFLGARKLVAIPPWRAADAMMLLVLGTLVGGRLGYVLVYDPGLLVSFEASPPFWGLLAIQRGGMASHGGMVGLVAASWAISRGFRREDGTREGASSVAHVMDVAAVLSPFGIFLGRVANFVNGELLGRIVAAPGERGPWWSVRFPQELAGWIGPGVKDARSHTPDLSDAQLGALDAMVRSVQRAEESWHGALMRVISNAGAHRAELAHLLSARHPSQLYQAAAEGLVLGMIVWAIWALPRRPGLVAAWWLIVYGVLRVLTEFIRLPDAQFGAAGRIYGLSRGQWLSVLMVAAGVAMLAWVLRRGAPAVGGWLRPTRIEGPVTA